ncbi:phosphonate ABC transporter [Vulcanococcus sp.]|jgi:phosphonate transport system permease protein|uniref:phosphonate ABC transporter n=1 Tax=Vulcanococcus sp. TaxID=2856995 RepID=UPI0037D9C847
MRPAAPLLPLLPALVLLPMALVLPGLVHGGGWELIGAFVAAALHPSGDPLVLGALVGGLGTTVGMALLGWAMSLLLGLPLGLLSSRLLWRSLVGTALPAELVRRLLAVPRSIHELIWGLLLLQLVGQQAAVAVLAIAIPFGALVARVVSDLLDALPERNLQGLLAAGTPAPAALLTALGPPLLPGLISYGGYRLECALRSATLLGVFGLGGLGNELLLTLQSLQFRELWSGLWLLLAVMLSLEALVSALRRRWSMPARLALEQRRPVGRCSRELVLAAAALVPLLLGVGRALAVDPAALLHWQSLPPLPAGGWQAALQLPWLTLVGETVLLTTLAAALAVGGAPLLLLLVAPWPWGRWLLRLVWALGRLWPPPLTALLLLFVFKPSLWIAALALGFHNLGILGRLLLEGVEAAGPEREDALRGGGSGARLALLYGRFSGLARSYLAYGAYRADVILRETVVVGLVAGTGLGSQLRESLSDFAFDQLALLLAAYALLTLLGEDLSDRARRALLRP